MRTTQIFLFIGFVFALISCKNVTNPNIQNQQKIISSVMPVDGSISIEQQYLQFIKNQSQINLIRYNVRRIDTFESGHVWNHTGKATLERNDEDSIFKFSFFGKRDDLTRENYYIEDCHYQVFPDTKSFRIETNYGTHVLGAPGGQMVVVDLLNTDSISAKISLVDKDSNSFLMVTIKITDGYTVEKVVAINKSTLLPFQICKRVTKVDLGYYQSTTFLISDVLINEQVKMNELSTMDFLTNYTQEIKTEDRSADILIGKKVPVIILKTFNNDTIDIRSLESKIVLLDFWELWCGPCIQAIPKIEAIEKKYRSKGLITLGIATDNIEKVKKYAEKEGLDFILVEGNARLKSIFKINSVPRYVLIDRKGVVSNIYYGYSDDIEQSIINLTSR